ncbi:MAG: TolC family protein, partial [Acidobacteriota bacterium]
NAVANLLGPIFTGGQRRAEVTAAEARQQQAAAAYAGAVLTALREVEDALLRDRAVQERLTFTGTRLEEARAAHEIARERYRRGVLPLLQVLETERRLRQAEEAQVAAQGDAWNIRVDLMLALGGDWTAEPPPGAADPARAAATAETAEASVGPPAPEAPSTSPDSLNSIEEESR